MIDFPDGTARRMHDRWRERLGNARSAYEQNPTVETRDEFRRVLQLFADLVLRHKVPEQP